MALHAGTKPLLMDLDQCLHLVLSYHDTLPTQPEAHTVFPNIDGRIAQAWQKMTQFCSLVNLATEAHGRIPWDLFLGTMTSVIHSLQYISFGPGSLNELVRLALLVVSSHVFLQWKSVTVPFYHLTAAYWDALLHDDALRNTSSQSNCWFFMIGAVAVFTEADNHWLRPRLKAHLEDAGVTSWAKMQRILNSFLWVRVLHESLGRMIFFSLIET